MPVPVPLNRLKRTVAVLLPMSILWVFAACVLICGWEHAAAHGETALTPADQVTETADSPDSEGCPDAAFLKAATTARMNLRPASHVVSGLPASTFDAVSRADDAPSVSPYRRRLPTDPPLRLLPTLRI